MLFNRWQQVEEYYQSSTVNPSENTLLQHFGGSPLYKDAAHLNSIDIDYLNRRASQNTIDIWHLSGKSQSDFTHSSLINFESHSKSIYSSFVGYLAQFTRLFYSSLQLYLSNEPDALLGDVNDLIQTVLQTVQQLQQQPVPPRSNIHVDLELKYKYNTKPSHEANVNEAADDFDADPKFKYPTPKPVKSQMAKPEIDRAEERKEGKMQRGPKGKSYDFEKEGGMKRILRELLMSISKSYHHYALELNGMHLKAYELQTSIPRCSVEYSPLCKLFNTISRMKDRKCAEDEALITISFHRYFDHLCLYLLVRGVDGKIHGQRIFLNELTTVLVQLFKDQVITEETLSALNEVQLKEDKDFTKFADFLKEKEVNEIDLVQPGNGIFDQLNEFIFEYNQYRDIAHQIDGYAVTRCFRDNIMDYTDFAALNSNLKRYGIRAGPVRKLWRFLNPVGMVEDEDEQQDEGVVVIPPGTYMYIPSEYEEVLFDNNDGEYIHFEIGESLTVPSDWSDDDE